MQKNVQYAKKVTVIYIHMYIYLIPLCSIPEVLAGRQVGFFARLAENWCSVVRALLWCHHLVVFSRTMRRASTQRRQACIALQYSTYCYII